MISQAFVIIPSFNIVVPAGNTFKDVPGQNLANYEMIAVNDCSSDLNFQNTRAIFDDPPAPSHLVRHAETPGAPAARNTRGDNAEASNVLLSAGDGWRTKDPS